MNTSKYILEVLCMGKKDISTLSLGAGARLLDDRGSPSFAGHLMSCINVGLNDGADEQNKWVRVLKDMEEVCFLETLLLVML